MKIIKGPPNEVTFNAKSLNVNQTCFVDNWIVSLDDEKDREGQDDEEEEGRENVKSDDRTRSPVVVGDVSQLHINPLTGRLFPVRPES